MDSKAAKRKLTQFYILLTFAVLTTVACIIGLVGGHLLEQSTYADLTSVSSGKSLQSQQKSYHKAIELRPQDKTAYLRLLDTYGEDGVFTKAESEDFLSVYNANRRKIEDLSDVCTEAGLLYINAYEGSSSARLRMALPFLEKAKPKDAETKKIVSCYTDMGQIYQNYIWNVDGKELSGEELEALLISISETLDALGDSKDPAVLHNKLVFSTSVCSLLNEQRNLLAASVPEDAVIGILDQIFAGLPALDETPDAAKDLVNALTESKAGCYDMIRRAYERTEVA